jgi:hypothetical protein
VVSCDWLYFAMDAEAGAFVNYDVARSPPSFDNAPVPILLLFHVVGHLLHMFCCF